MRGRWNCCARWGCRGSEVLIAERSRRLLGFFLLEQFAQRQAEAR
jgi:hypothetical protein